MRVTTGGRSQHDRREFVLEYDPQAVVQPDIDWLVHLLEEAAASSVCYGPRETLRLGWVDLIVGEADGGYLTLLEPDWTGAVPIKYVPSVTQALVHFRRQKDVADSLDLIDQLAFPNIVDSGLVCTMLGTRPCGVMDRMEPEARDSGWFFGCDDRRHDHESPDELRRESLYRIACTVPGTVQFCALPAGLSITFGGPEPVSITMAGKPARIRPGSYLDQVRTVGRGSTS
jgi:hypothetical protein